MHQIQITGRKENIDKLPNECPFCHKSISPNLLYGHKEGNKLEVFMYCPDKGCRKSFIGYYQASGNIFSYRNETTKGYLMEKRFSNEITDISQSFVQIYNESFIAEQQNLNEICGVGFRKALEFLIKDYSILNNQNEKSKIENMTLGNCIKTFVDDSRIKSVAKRAVWIGNDETHYIRKWEGSNLKDMKKLIELTIHWIEMEQLTKSFELEMPE